MKKMSDGVILFLKKTGLKLKDAVKMKYVRVNSNGVYVLTGKGNKVKQSGGTVPRPGSVFKILNKYRRFKNIGD